MYRYLSSFLLGLLFLCWAACETDRDGDLMKITLNDSLTVTVSPPPGPLANGVDSVPILCRLNSVADSAFFQFDYAAAGGMVLGLREGKLFLKDDEATAHLRAGLVPGTYSLSVFLNNDVQYARHFSITLAPSLPDTLLVEADKSMADTTSNSFVTFSVYLRKTRGAVSLARSISARAYQLRGTDTVDVGRFAGLVSNRSDSAGKISLQYYTDTRDLDNSHVVEVAFSSGTNQNRITTSIYRLVVKQ
ncbi:hypothetical protein [Chitinophaga sp. YIM B06452]|uniref:hypothetical protein n=1 Tax=Chitinophaga sp. YIM B06452 TaxID=3082158 RepID=UPI0031FED41E